MKFGIQHPNFSYDGTGPQIVESLKRVVTKAESLNFDSFWVMDHFHQIGNLGPPSDPMLEGWTTISVMAEHTSKIRLGTLVTGNAYRHPSVLAKIGATFDVLSKGRLFMGIGAAWNEEEAEAYGIWFPEWKERFERLEEAVQVIKAMWTEEPANFSGKYYELKNAHCNPKPIQTPHPSIMVGGGGEKQTLRIAAKYADACNVFGSPETVKRKLRILHEHCKAAGRDYGSILKTKLGVVVTAEDRKAAEDLAAKIFGNVPEDVRREYAIYGNPDDIRRSIEEFRDAGIEYFIASFIPELDGLELFGNEVVKRL